MRIGESTNQTDLLAALETTRNRRIDLRRGFEAIWWNNIALVTGDHYAQFNPVLAKFEDRDTTWDNLDGKKPRIVINHALTVSRTELSKLTKSKPVMEIVANSDEQSDIAATKVGRAALQYAEWKFRLRKLRKNSLWWMIQTGLGGTYVGWDYLNETPGFFEATIDPATGEPTFDPERKRELEEMKDRGELDDIVVERYPLGEIDYRTFSPFQLLPDETATDFTELRDLITDEIYDIDVLKGIYGRDANHLNPDSALQLGVMEQRTLARAGVPGGMGSSNSTVENGCRVSTFWLLPGIYRGNRILKQGVMVKWCQGKILDFHGIFPYQDNRIPFVFDQHIPTSTTIWPDSVLSHIRGPNLEIDKTVSQLIENKDYMANPMWLIATQHRIKGTVKNVAGGIVRYRHVPNIPPPQPIAGLQMPAQVENIVSALREQILEISGQSEVARGNVPSGVRSGVAVAYLQEQDDTKIGPTVDNMEEAIALQGSMTLERFSQFYTFQRVLRFYRRDGIFDVLKFKGADLKNNTDVICQAGSAMPQMKAAKQQYTLELISLGVLKDPHKIEQMLELGQGEPDDVDKAIAQANRENNMMLHGVWGNQAGPSAGAAPPSDSRATPTPDEAGDQTNEEGFRRMSAAVPVKKWHNHAVHRQRHMSVMMDEEFDNLAISHPDIVRLFDEHLAMHDQMIAEQEQAKMQMLMAAKGAPDGPPGNSPDAQPGPPPDGSAPMQPDPTGQEAMALPTG